MLDKKKSKALLTRKASIKDLEDILRLNFALFKEEYKKYDKSLNLKWTYAEGKKYFKKRIASKNGFVGIAEIKGEIAGYLCGGISKGKIYRKKAKYAELENMVINGKLRGRGIGTMLVNDFLKWCKENRVGYISVTASVKNKQAADFYRKFGFKDYNLTLEREC